MHKLKVTLPVLLSLVLYATALAAPLKPRMIVLTDISPVNHEPDDMESMIRLLVHADLFEIEGLVATTGWSYSQATRNSLDLIHQVIDAYEKDLPHLLQRSGQTDFLSDESRQEIGYWPSPDYLRSRVVMGSTTRGQSYIGESNDSAGSRLIIQSAGESDDRPVWVQAWGGGNTVAQAIWTVREERTEDELKTFLHKIRVYTITDQDRGYQSGTPFDISSHQWMRREFEKDLVLIWDECAWKFQNGTGKSNWEQYETHIQRHGNLGNIYPKYRYGVEGDTPAFLHIMPVGLNDPDVPGQGGWGGYFEWAKGPDNETYAYTNHQSPAYGICRELEGHFYEATFNNFAARMDWAKDGAGNRNPVVAVNSDDSMDIMTLRPQQGVPVTLDASQSHDPDGDDLTFNWWVISGAGTYTQDIRISNSNLSRATVEVPEDSAGKTFHVICEVTDDGAPNLTGYRRVVFEPIGPATQTLSEAMQTGGLAIVPSLKEPENAPKLEEKDFGGYLMVYFKDQTQSAYMAVSRDGYTFTDLNNGQPIFDGAKLAEQKGVRDPHITRGPDGGFYLAMTDLHIFGQRAGFRETRWQRPEEKYGWGNNRAIVLMKSFDLIHWTHSDFRVDTAFPELGDIDCSWAPQTIYDEAAGKMMVYFTIRYNNENANIYCSHTDEAFTKLETTPQIIPDISGIDADITKVGDKFHMHYVSRARILYAVSDTIDKGYQARPERIDPESVPTEAPNVFKRLGTDTYVLMYDVYGARPNNMGFSETTDFVTYKDIGHFNEGVMKGTNFSRPKHGAVTYLTPDELKAIAEHWKVDIKLDSGT